jgi:hypothetical protein
VLLLPAQERDAWAHLGRVLCAGEALLPLLLLLLLPPPLPLPLLLHHRLPAAARLLLVLRRPARHTIATISPPHQARELAVQRRRHAWTAAATCDSYRTCGTALSHTTPAQAATSVTSPGSSGA